MKYTIIYQLFVKHTTLFILGACFYMYLIQVLGAQKVHTHKHVSNF